ncbi:hypothetical protein N7540_001629 [Penicillium herquei]|nr:hypothetical protein N7540_001629 [Penicillium herquei]
MVDVHNNIRITTHFMTSATQQDGSDASTNAAKSDKSTRNELAGTNNYDFANVVHEQDASHTADSIVANSHPVRRVQMIANHFQAKKTCSPPDAIRVLFQTINSPDMIKQFAQKCTSAQVTPHGIDFYVLAPNRYQYAIISVPWSADKHHLFNCLNDNDFFALMILVEHAWAMQEKLGVFEMSIPATLN